MTSPSPSAPHSSALRRLKAAHDAARAAEALKRGDRGRAAELYLSAAAAPRSTSAAAAVSAANTSERARALSNASAALCAAGRFKEALEAADEAVRLSSPELEEEEEEGGDGAPSSSPPSLALCLSPPPPSQQPPHHRRRQRKGRQTLGWSKPHWRRGAALRGLGDHLAAAMAFADAHGALEREARKVAKGENEKTAAAENGAAAAARLAECAAAVREAVFKGARCASDAASLLCDAVLRPAEEAWRLLPRSPLSGEGGAAAAESLRAAAAAVVAGLGGDADESGSDPHNALTAATSVGYLSSLSRWLVRAPSLPQLLFERSCVFSAAGQWRAAAADARRALELSLAAEEENQLSTSTIVLSRVVSDSKKEKESRDEKNSTRAQEKLQPAPSDAAALALARALLARRGHEGGGGHSRDCRGAAEVLAEGIARIRRRALFFSSSDAASSSAKESASSSRRERAASALAAPLVELLRKVQASEELPPGEVGEILLSSLAASESRGGGGELPPPPRSLRRRLRLGFEFSDSSSSLDAGGRSDLLLCVSKALRVPRAAVALEKVFRSSSGALSLSLSVSGASGAEEEEGDASLSLDSRLRSALEEVGLSPTRIQKSFYNDEDEAKEKETEEEGGSSSSSSSSSSALVPLPPPQPALQLSLPLPPPPPPPPRLTDAAGRPLPPLPRHAFALSRVHYSSKDQSERSVRSWTDAPRLGLRWRQSAAEVSVIVASVAAAGLSAAEVDVLILPRRLVVASKVGRRGEENESGDDDGEATKARQAAQKKKKLVFLDLALERMVVPDESTWTLISPGGIGEEGLLVTLAKANVELFAATASSSSAAPSPSLTWWPRLASRVEIPEMSADEGNGGDETAVAWDDYEKDYSDLPRFAAERVSAAEAALRLKQDSSGGGGAGGGSCGGGATAFSGVVSSAGLDRALRRSLACADDSRRRHRAGRLREMRREVISRGEEAGRRRSKREEEEEKE